jgi:3-oxoacyl-[acyl-carrier protein] reductase
LNADAYKGEQIMNPENKVALITGSAQGLGRCIAETLASKGIEIIINDIPSQKEVAENTLKAFIDKGYRTHLKLADVTSMESVLSMADEIYNEFGSIDILINNAGINIDGLVKDRKKEDWDKIININLTGAYVCMSAVIPYMAKKNYGRIVNVASVVGRTGIMGTPYYAASKAGLIGLTKATAMEVARKGILVNAIAPGYIDTMMMASYKEEIIDSIVSKIPLGRFAKPEEIAKVIAFLVSDECTYMTGAVLDVNGGFWT